MKKLFLLTVVLAISLPLFAAPNLYVSHEKLKKITVIDTAAGEILTEIPLKTSVAGMKLDPDEKYLYYISADTNALYRIRCKNLTVDTDFVSVGSDPAGLAVSNDNKAVYVINAKSNNISIINTATFDSAGDPIKLPGSPRAIVITDDDRKAYIALADMKGVALLDLGTNKVLGVIPVSADPWSMCTYLNRLLFVSNTGMASVVIIDMKKNAVINEMVTTDMPRGMAAYNNMLYVSVMNGVDIFELKGYTKPSSVGLDYPVYDCVFGKTAAGPRIFVAGFETGAAEGKVAVINPGENGDMTEIAVAGAPKFIEIRKIKPTPVPTIAPTLAPTSVPPTAVPTAVPTLVPTAVATKAPTPEDTPTKVAVKKHKKKATPVPEPTATPDMRLRSDLSGTVFMDNRPVVAGIKIKAISKHTDKIYTELTDGSGTFIFKALPIGAYVVSVDATYIAEKAVAVTVNKGRNPDLVINTKKRQ